MDSKGSANKFRPLLALLAVAMVVFPATLFAAPISLSSPLDSRDATSGESSFGDLVTDSILDAAPGADFAISPAAETRPVLIPAGKSTTDELTQSLRAASDPSDTVVTMNLSGAQVIAALAHGSSRAPSPFDGFLQVSGLTVRYDPAKSGNARVVSATTSRGETIKPQGTYTVAMPEYLSEGALGYFAIFDKAGAASDTHKPITTVVANYASAHQPLSYSGQGRISG